MVLDFRRFLVVVVLMIMAFGCASNGKAITKDGINDGLKLPASFGQAGTADQYGENWWEIFESVELNALVDKLFQNNYQLAKSYDGLKALRTTLGISEADKIPSVTAGASASETYSTNSKGKRAWRDSYSLSLTASYEADIWGRVKAGTESDRLALISNSYDLESLYMTLTAELADRYFLYKSLASILKIQKEQYELRLKQISALEMMYSSGVGLLDTIYVKQTAMANLMESMTETKQSMESARLQIAKLIGEPDVSKVVISDKYNFKLPQLPYVIPSDVANKRPDIKAAFASVQKVDRDVAQAMANRYPKLSFSASTSFSGDELTRLISIDNFIANLVANIVAPVFDAGKLKLQVEKQKHLLSQQVNDYYLTVITALTEMSNSLNDNVQNEQALDLSTEKVRIEEKRLKIAEMKYEMGIKNYSDVIDNKISLLAGWISEVTARRSLISSRVELARASGGSWAGKIVDQRLTASTGETK